MRTVAGSLASSPLFRDTGDGDCDSPMLVLRGAIDKKRLIKKPSGGVDEFSVSVDCTDLGLLRDATGHES